MSFFSCSLKSYYLFSWSPTLCVLYVPNFLYSHNTLLKVHYHNSKSTSTFLKAVISQNEMTYNNKYYLITSLGKNSRLGWVTQSLSQGCSLLSTWLELKGLIQSSLLWLLAGLRRSTSNSLLLCRALPQDCLTTWWLTVLGIRDPRKQEGCKQWNESESISNLGSDIPSLLPYLIP